MLFERKSRQSFASNTDKTTIHFSINLGTAKLILVSGEIVLFWSCIGQGKEFLSFKASEQALDPTQPHIQWGRELFPPGYTRRGVILTTQIHWVPRLRVQEGKLPLPYLLERNNDL